MKIKEKVIICEICNDDLVIELDDSISEQIAFHSLSHKIEDLIQ